MAVFWRCTLHWLNTTLGTRGQNVIHLSDPTEARTADQMGGYLDDFWWGANSGDAARRITSTNVRLDMMGLQRLWPEPALGVVTYAGLKRIGGTGVSVFHPVLGALFRFKTGLAGPREHGRFYHYGTVSNEITNGRLNLGVGNQFGLTVTQWTNNFIAGAGTNPKLQLFHRSLQGEARWSPVTTIQIVGNLGVVRPRNFDVGI